MRSDGCLNDAVRFVAGNLFTDRLFKILKICAGANPANGKSSSNYLWRQIRPSPHRHPYIRTDLARTRPSEERIDRSQKLVGCCCCYVARAGHLDSTGQSIVAVYPAPGLTPILECLID